MRVAVVVDEKYGMMFNKRRQSKDEVLRAYLLELCGDEPLYMNAYTSKQFNEGDPIIVADDFLELVNDGIAFVENVDLTPYVARIETLYLCCWNRTYPSDVTLSSEVLEHFKEYSTTEMNGKSHEKITITEMIKCEQ